MIRFCMLWVRGCEGARWWSSHVYLRCDEGLTIMVVVKENHVE